jgi:hypothetical protein
MSLEFDATYRDGALYPESPLNLPQNAPVHVVVVPKSDAHLPTKEETAARRPASPRITSEEFRARIAKYAVRVGTLPPDFSREDIYSDHD